MKIDFFIFSEFLGTKSTTYYYSLLHFQLNIPVLTMPFAIPTIVMIYVTDKCKFLNRVHDMTYPEKQAYEWHTGTKAKLNENQGQNSRILVLLLLFAHFLKSPKTTTTVNV